MEKEMNVENEITVQASASRTWDFLVNPAKTKYYMFGCEVVSDFQVGSQIDWRAEVEGKQIVFVTGKVVAFEPETLFSYTTFDPNSTLEDIPENHTTVTMRLQSQGDSTIIKVKQGDFATVGDGQARYDEVVAAGGWSHVLSAIKELVEG